MVFHHFSSLHETLAIPHKNRQNHLTVIDIDTQSVGEHDRQVPLQLRKHPAIQKLRFKSTQMRPLQIPITRCHPWPFFPVPINSESTNWNNFSCLLSQTPKRYLALNPNSCSTSSQLSLLQSNGFFFPGSAAGAAALKFGSAGSPRVACPTSVPERLEL